MLVKKISRKKNLAGFFIVGRKLFGVEGRMSFALIFRVIVDDVNIFAGDVANVVDITKLARLRVDEDIALQNVLSVRDDERALFGLAEESVDERFDNAVVAHGHEDVRLEFRGSLKVLVEHDFQVGVHKNPPSVLKHFI